MQKSLLPDLKSNMRLLLTGFEPFGGTNINSSWETAVRVELLAPKDVNIEIHQLPVGFKRAGMKIRTLLNDRIPDVLVMLGQRSTGQTIDIERVALNLMDSTKPDNDGFYPQEQMIIPYGESAHFSNMPVKILRDALLQRNIPAKVSNSAGLYVCNCTYYNALNEIYEQQLQTKAVFIHLPKINQEFSVNFIADSVKTIIETIVDNI